MYVCMYVCVMYDYLHGAFEVVSLEEYVFGEVHGPPDDGDVHDLALGEVLEGARHEPAHHQDVHEGRVVGHIPSSRPSISHQKRERG